MRRLPFSRRIWFGPSVSLDRRRTAQSGTPAGRRLDQQRRQAAAWSRPVRQAQHHVEPAVAVDDLRHDAAVGQALQRLRRPAAGRERRRARRRVVDEDLQLRDAAPAFRSAGRPARGCAASCAAAHRPGPQRVEIVAEDLRRSGAHAGQHVVEPMEIGWPMLTHRQHRQAGANVVQDLVDCAGRRSAQDRRRIRWSGRPRRARRLRPAGATADRLTSGTRA